jgi:hypothetical protein
MSEKLSDQELNCWLAVRLFGYKWYAFLARGKTGTRYGNTQKTLYGENLRYTTVRELVKAPFELLDGRNAAVWAYLRKLDYDTKVALYWH